MKVTTRWLLAAGLALGLGAASAQSLELEQLLGTWNMSYDMGQGPQTGTIIISKNEEGAAKIMMSTTGGGDSEARDIKIENDELTFARDISAQGQGLSVSYKAKLVDGKLAGSFELDLGALAGAAGGLGGPTEWEATKAEAE